MDPFSALSIATSVVQFVDFGVKLISKSKELYRSTDGVLADHAEQAAVATRLRELARLLTPPLPNTSLDKLSLAEKALFEITKECQDLADEFIDALDELRASERRQKWKSFRQALKSVWKSAGIERRLVSLDRLRQLIIVHLLVVLKEGHIKSLLGVTGQMRNMEDTILRAVSDQKHAFGDELAQLKKQLAELAQNEPASKSRKEPQKTETLDTIRDKLLNNWREENKETLRKILGAIQHDEENKKQKSYRRMVLESLYFPHMHDRQNMVHEREATTLDWVFDPPSHILREWCDFSGWLLSDCGLYWISGKAGSGKSTLMKWLLQEDRTRAHLDRWAHPQRLVLASHFFWNSGGKHQKSLSGALRSLMYELLSQCPEPIWHVSPLRWRSHDLELSHFPSWTDGELFYALRLFFRHVAGNVRICLFIDGLDEFVGDDHQLVQLVKLFQTESKGHVKVCISSRPWEFFKDAFSPYPRLRLEDLTRLDIECYIASTLLSDSRFQSMQRINSMQCTQLVHEIIGKAKGVWLWVVLVVRSLLRGLQNHDTIMDLQARLRQIPEELEDYFLQMFSSIDSVYRVKSLKLLKLTLHDSRGVSLMTSSFLDEESIDFPYGTSLDAISDDCLDKRLQRAEKRVNIMCFDLLETASWDHERHVFHQHSIEFFHRTARDFLLDKKNQVLVNMEAVDSFDVNLFMCKALLAQLKMTRAPTRLLVADFMHYATFLEKASSPELPLLLEHVDKILLFHRESEWTPGDSSSNSPANGWSCRDQGRKPLLSLAIQYGLRRYVLANLSNDPNLIFQKRPRPLLDFILRRRVYSLARGPSQQIDLPVGGPNDTPDIEILTLALQHGADPNEMLGTSSVWERFLQYLSTFCEDIQQLDDHDNFAWIQAAELLIRSGARRTLACERYIPRQPCSKIIVRTAIREVTARSSLAAAFGEEEAERLDLLSMWRNLTGRNLLIKTIRTVQYALRFVR